MSELPNEQQGRQATSIARDHQEASAPPERTPDAKHLRELTRRARSSLIATVSAGAVVLLIVWNLSDANLILQRIPIAVPGVGASVPVLLLLYGAPLLLLGAYLRFRVRVGQIQELLHGLSSDERNAADAIVRASGLWFFFRRGWNRVAFLAGWLSLALPIVALWGRSLAIHDVWLTAAHASFVALALGALAYDLLLPAQSPQQTRRTAVAYNIPIVALVSLVTLGAVAYASNRAFDSSNGERTDVLFIYHPKASPLQAAGMQLDAVDLSKLTDHGLVDANLSGAALNGAVLSALNLAKTSLAQARLERANLSGAVLIESDLSRANLRGANLAGANLSDATLIQADLQGAFLSKSNEEGPKQARGAACAERWKRVCSDRKRCCHERVCARLQPSKGRLDLSGVQLSRADLSGLDLREANLSGAILVGADLTCADLSGANLSGAKLMNAQLADADLSGALLTSSVITDADFSNATLEFADLSNAVAHRAWFGNAECWSAYFEGAELRHANLTDISLRRARMAGAKFGNTRMTGAHIDYSIGLDESQFKGFCGSGVLTVPSPEQPVATPGQPQVQSDSDALTAVRLEECLEESATKWRAFKSKPPKAQTPTELDTEEVLEAKRERFEDREPATFRTRDVPQRVDVPPDPAEKSNTTGISLGEVRVVYRAPENADINRRKAGQLAAKIRKDAVSVSVTGSSFAEVKSDKPRPHGEVQIVYRKGEHALGQQVRDLVRDVAGEAKLLYSRSMKSGTVAIWVL